jgi:uncharacterized membrane-anchored protein
MRAPQLLISSLLLTSGSAAFAQEPPPPAVDPAAAAAAEAAESEQALAAFAWQNEGVAKLGTRATMNIPAEMRFLGAAEASRLVEAMGNLTSKQELGLLATKNMDWFVVFFFDDIGFVKDDDKDELDAQKMATEMSDNLLGSNEERREHGLEELHFDGWAIPPRYNEQTKQLEWAHRLRSASGTSVNFNTRILGRKGVMRVILVTDPELLEATLPAFRSAMESFTFVEQETYASYREGDKIAEYGLVALVAGGVGAVAVKTGLLAGALAFFKKGAKLIVVAVIAALGAIKKLFTGKKDPNPTA